MGDHSAIEWTDATWNPVRGCSIVSKGCTNCYAMRQAHRSHGAGGAYEGLTKMTKGGPVWTGEIRLVPELLDQPLKWKRPRRIFVNSMSDLFHEDVPDDFIVKVWQVMYDCQAGATCAQPRHADNRSNKHIFQILTKRPERMLRFVSRLGWQSGRIYLDASKGDYRGIALPNVWLGVSVEDQAAADERIPLLTRTPAAVRWISAEPLLSSIDISLWLRRVAGSHTENPLNHERLDWVVAGGESGPGARPMHPDWAISLRDQCAIAGVPYFFKQWGAWAPFAYFDQATGERLLKLIFTKRETLIGGPADGTTAYNMRRIGKKAAGRELDGRTHDEYPA